MIEFVIPMDPVAKGRPRISTIHGKAFAFTPKETVVAERTMAVFAREAMAGKAPLTGVLEVSVHFVLRKPQSVKREYPTTKPDLDNYVKMLDAFNGILWEDDSQVVHITAKKKYCEEGVKPYILVKLFQLMTAEENGHKKTTIKGRVKK
jgi:Holliday junction resolvase RusA-like endonuclease